MKTVHEIDNLNVSRRSLLKAIGLTAGVGAMYQTMVEMGYAANSDFTGPIQLSPAPKGATVLILGAGIAGMVAAYEMRKVGYNVQILEYNDRPGGRNWTLHAGDSYTELGGRTKKSISRRGSISIRVRGGCPITIRASCITPRC